MALLVLLVACGRDTPARPEVSPREVMKDHGAPCYDEAAPATATSMSSEPGKMGDYPEENNAQFIRRPCLDAGPR